MGEEPNRTTARKPGLLEIIQYSQPRSHRGHYNDSFGNFFLKAGFALSLSTLLFGYGLHFFLIFASFARSSMTGRSVNTVPIM